MFRRKDRHQPGDGSLPGYSDLAEIGGGAFATVYSATEDATGRRVALKVLKLETVHATLIETFQREIQALGQVSDHPNIVTLYRPFTAPDGRPVLVLELCRDSLATLVRTSGPLDARTVTGAGIKIAGALETAHRSGFLHRDMKPQNILSTQFGEPVLADFGVAALQASAQVTAGVFGFTTVHAPPEILEGQPLSAATDVYGLASSMYQLLTGQAPFAAFENEAPASVILRILRDPARPLSAQEIPLGLADLVASSLSKRPEDRPQSALEFARTLQSVEAAADWSATHYVVWGGDSPVPANSFQTRLSSDAPVAAGPVLAPRPADRDWPAGGRPVSDSLSPSLPPLLPPPFSPGTRGPSVESPDPVDRHVITPPRSDRGQPSPPVQPPPVTLDPLEVPTEAGGPVTGRPQFVDPNLASGPVEFYGEPHPARARSGESVYESTMQIGQLFSAEGRAAPEPAEPSPGARGALPAAVWAGVAAGLVVVLAAVLLIAGVL